MIATAVAKVRPQAIACGTKSTAKGSVRIRIRGSTTDGLNVGISGDGTLFAIGAIFEGGNNNGVGAVPNETGGTTGAVYLVE